MYTGIGTQIHILKYKFNLTEVEIIERAVAAVKYAPSFVDDEFYAEDAGRKDNEYLARVIVEAGATVVNIPGYNRLPRCSPSEYEKKIKYLVDHGQVLRMQSFLPINDLNGCNAKHDGIF